QHAYISFGKHISALTRKHHGSTPVFTAQPNARLVLVFRGGLHMPFERPGIAWADLAKPLAALAAYGSNPLFAFVKKRKGLVIGAVDPPSICQIPRIAAQGIFAHIGMRQALARQQ